MHRTLNLHSNPFIEVNKQCIINASPFDPALESAYNPALPIATILDTNKLTMAMHSNLMIIILILIIEYIYIMLEYTELVDWCLLIWLK
jgi:hypothetical protein